MTYSEAMHAVQTGIQFTIDKLGLAEAGCSPKHLRVGVDSSHVTHQAIAELLIAKGVFTLDEYTAALTKAANDEVVRWQNKVRAIYGTDNITLH